MVSLDQLEALDLLIWLGTSERAGRMARTNQSTISRRSRQVLRTFELHLSRSSDGWRTRGNESLLALERQLHQHARLLGHRPLRLQAPFWTGHRRLRRLPPGWRVNPPSAMAVCENPVALLRSHVIDAALLTPTQMPPEQDDLVCMEIYGSPIELTVLTEGGLSDPLGAYQALRELGALVLRQPSFLPHSCLLRCQDWFNELLPGTDRSELPARRSLSRTTTTEMATGLSVAFLTPEMRRVQALP